MTPVDTFITLLCGLPRMGMPQISSPIEALYQTLNIRKRLMKSAAFFAQSSLHLRRSKTTSSMMAVAVRCSSCVTSPPSVQPAITTRTFLVSMSMSRPIPPLWAFASVADAGVFMLNAVVTPPATLPHQYDFHCDFIIYGKPFLCHVLYCLLFYVGLVFELLAMLNAMPLELVAHRGISIKVVCLQYCFARPIRLTFFY